MMLWSKMNIPPNSKRPLWPYRLPEARRSSACTSTYRLLSRVRNPRWLCSSRSDLLQVRINLYPISHSNIKVRREFLFLASLRSAAEGTEGINHRP